MIVLLFLTEGVVVRRAPLVLLRCLPLQGFGVVRAPWLGWVLPPLPHLGECLGVVALREGGCCDLPKCVAPSAGVASAW